MRVFVIGGTRFIGPYVVQRLVDMGHEITIFHRGQTTSELPVNVTEILGDRNDLFRYKSEIEKLSPDVVLDMFPYTEDHAQAVVQTFNGIAKRAVAISSMDVYASWGTVTGFDVHEVNNVQIHETSPVRKRHFQFREKVPAEHLFHHYEKLLVEKTFMNASNLPASILRLPVVYGPGDAQHRLYDYVRRMEDNRPYIVIDNEFANWKWSRAYVENVAQAIALAVVDDSAHGIYNVCDAVTLTIGEMIDAIGQQIGWNGKVLTVPQEDVPIQYQFEGNTEQQMDMLSSRIRNELGFQDLVSLEDSIRQTIAWERSHPPANQDTGIPYDVEDEIVQRSELFRP